MGHRSAQRPAAAGQRPAQVVGTPCRVDLEVNAAHIGTACRLTEAQPGGRADVSGPGPARVHLIQQQALLQQARQQGLQHSTTGHRLPADGSHDQEVNVTCHMAETCQQVKLSLTKVAWKSLVCAAVCLVVLNYRAARPQARSMITMKD